MDLRPVNKVTITDNNKSTLQDTSRERLREMDITIYELKKAMNIKRHNRVRIIRVESYVFRIEECASGVCQVYE